MQLLVIVAYNNPCTGRALARIHTVMPRRRINLVMLGISSMIYAQITYYTFCEMVHASIRIKVQETMVCRHG
ncbi:hypothetical protein BJX99DRAFT_234315 [Aspergillus californicus]